MIQQPVPESERSRFVSPTAKTETRVRKRMLFVARCAWVLLTAGMLASLIPSIPAYYYLQHRVCDSPTNCLLFNQATPGKLLALQRLGFSLDDFARYTVGLQVIVTVLFLGMGGLLFWRKSNTWLGLSASFFLILLGCSGIFESLSTALSTTNAPLVLQQLVGQLYALADPVLGIFLLIFPTGRFTPRWSWVVGLLWATNIISFSLPAPYTFFYWAPALQASDILLEVGSLIIIQVYRYRRIYTLVERQQTKWLFFGFAGGALSFVFFYFVLPALPVLNAPDSPLQLLDSLGAVLLYSSIPVGISIAIMRYRLWDIDAIINKALVYGVLTALLAALYFGLILGLESLGSILLGNARDQPVALVVSTLAIAALFQPARRRIQSVIDRRFYRQKYDVARTLEAFRATLKQEVDFHELQQQLLAVVGETMRPAHVSLWLCVPQGQREALSAGRTSLPGLQQLGVKQASEDK